MFGGNGVWLHTYIGGIDNAPGSIGYEHVLFAPPADLIAASVRASRDIWTTNSIEARQRQLKVAGAAADKTPAVAASLLEANRCAASDKLRLSCIYEQWV
mgnify:CR=1 FL=1